MTIFLKSSSRLSVTFVLWSFFLVASPSMWLPVPGGAQETSNQKLIDAARKEGEIVWYTTMSSDQSNVFMARFQQKYPFLKPSIIRLGGSALLSRIVTESKAGKNFFDVVHGTGEIVLPHLGGLLSLQP